jgi:3-hydroxyisobutyrate dehydrogenase
MMNIALIGTGLMGLSMAQRLLNAGHSVTVYNRTRAKAEPLVQEGAKLAETVGEAIAPAEAVILMLTHATAIREVLLPASERPNLTGKTIIQMSTIAPQESQQLQQEIEAAGGQYLEAPVLGSIPEAKAGTLIVMVGAPRALYEQWLPVLHILGSEPLYVGEVGSAAALKLAMNQLIGSLTAAFSLSLGLVQRYGVDVETFMGVVRQSALYAPTFDKKLSRMCDRHFENPNFPTKHLLKDMNLAFAAAEASGLNPAALDGVRQILEGAIQQGYADADYSALFASVVPEGER